MPMEKIKKWFHKQKEILHHELTQEPPIKIIKNFAFIILGAMLVAFGDGFFLLRMNIIAGGVSSIALLVYRSPGFNVIPLNIYVMIITWTFFFLGLLLLGVKYAFHTLLYTIFYPLFTMFFTFLIDVAVINGCHILDIAQLGKDIQLSNGVIPFTGNESAMLLLAYFVAALLGGLIIGSGIGMTLSGGGSSGGTDVINLLANKYLHIKVGTSSFIVDASLITIGFFVNGNNLLATLVGLIAAMLCSIMIDRVFLGNNQYYLAMIVSEKWSEINNFITRELGRGSTLVTARGGYTLKDSVVLEVCFDRLDYNIIRESINTFDPDAFVMIMQTKEIIGYGFSRNTPQSDKEINDIPVTETRKLVSKARAKRKNTFKEEIPGETTEKN